MRAVKRFDQIRYDPQLAPAAAQWRVELRLVAQTMEVFTGLSTRVAQFLVARGTLLAAFMIDAVVVSACVQFGLALPMISYFHRLSITGLSANIIIIPLLSLVVPFGFASILTGLHILAWLTKEFLVLAERIASWHANFEPAWRLAALPLWISIAFAVSLVLLAYVIRRRRIFIAPALACSLALFAAICWQPWKAERAGGISGTFGNRREPGRQPVLWLFRTVKRCWWMREAFRARSEWRGSPSSTWART